ncbi:MAG TPA: hypothetical protein VFZ13_13800, partial [Gemmatimonadales bacterium]
MSDWLARQPRGRFLAILAVVAAIGLAPQFLSRTLPDISFLLYAAGRVLDGATLYVDLIEINPPLIVWLNLPIVAAARELGISEITSYRVAVTLVLVGSLAACARIITRMEARSPAVLPSFRLSVLLIAFALFVLPRLDWGEREHLTLALVLPYLLLGVARLAATSPRSPRQGATGAMAPGTDRTVAGTPDVPAPVRRFAPSRVTLIGLAAAVGIALKPQFVLVWLVREAIVFAHTRRLTPEGLVVPVVGAAYLGAAALFTPEYFELVRTHGPAYQTFIHNPVLVTALLGDGAALAIGALIVTVALWRWTGRGELKLVLAGATLACYLAAVFQLKGWRYHFLPALALGWMLLAVLAVSVRAPLGRWTERLFASIAGASALTVAIAALAGSILQASDPLDPRYDADPSIGRLLPVLREHAAGRPVMVLSPNMASGFPLSQYAGTRWVQRYSNLWPVVAAYDSSIKDPAPFTFRPPAQATALEAALRESVAEDLARAEPDLVLVLRTGPDEPRWGMRRLDLIEYLRAEPRFAAAFAAYDSVGVVGQYVVHRRRGTPAFTLADPEGSPGAA